MLIANVNASPYVKELSDAAKEIAELKAKITKLEKVIDAVLAGHLAGGEPITQVTVDDQAGAHAPTTTIADAEEPMAGGQTPADDDGCHTCHRQETCACQKAQIENLFDDQKRHPEKEEITVQAGSLPAAVRTLICNPTQAALTSTDDLTLINGIDTATALELAALDLSRFSDIASLSADAVANLKQTLAAGEKIHKFGWIEQAAILAKGDLTAHAQNVLDAVSGNPQEGDITFKVADDNALPALPELDIPADDLEFDESFICQDSSIDTAEATLQDLALQNLPRNISIEWPITSLVQSPDDARSFLPMASVDAGFAVTKIAHADDQGTRDYGNMHALTASLAATVVILIASTATGVINLDADMVRTLNTDVCQLSGLSAFPDACKNLLGIVL